MIDKGKRRKLLEDARKGQGLSLDDMAVRTGLTKNMLWRAENDAANLPKPEVAAIICKGYGITMADLVQASGYDLGLGDIKQTAVGSLSLADYLHRKYSEILSYQSLATTLEELIESRRIRESREAEEAKGNLSNYYGPASHSLLEAP